MALSEFLLNNELLLETIFSFIVVLSSGLIFYHTRKLYLLSRYRGIRYFSNAFLYFALSLSGRYIFVLLKNYFSNISSNLVIIPPLLFFVVYTVSIGGFYLSYSLVWKYIEKGRLKDRRINVFFIHIVALLIATLETLFIITGFVNDLILVFTVQQIVLLFALISNYAHRKEEAQKDSKPYFLYVSIATFFMYLSFYLGELLDAIFPLIGIIILLVVSLLFLIILGHVRKLTKCC